MRLYKAVAGRGQRLRTFKLVRTEAFTRDDVEWCPLFRAQSMIVWANSQRRSTASMSSREADAGAHIASLDDQEREREVEH